MQPDYRDLVGLKNDYKQKTIIKNFLEYGLCQNKWLWFHSIVTILYVSIAKYFNFSSFMILLTVLLATIGWEILEYFIEIRGNKIIGTGYGSYKNWLYDSLGDIIFCNLISIILIIL
jgi:hypothetical protein